MRAQRFLLCTYIQVLSFTGRSIALRLIPLLDPSRIQDKLRASYSAQQDLRGRVPIT